MGTESFYRTPAKARFMQLRDIAGFRFDSELAEYLGLDKSTLSKYLSDDPAKRRDPPERFLDAFYNKLRLDGKISEQTPHAGVPTLDSRERNARMKYPDHEEGGGIRFHENDSISKKFRALSPEDQKEVEHIISYKLRQKKKTAMEIAEGSVDDALKAAGIKPKPKPKP